MLPYPFLKLSLDNEYRVFTKILAKSLRRSFSFVARYIGLVSLYVFFLPVCLLVVEALKQLVGKLILHYFSWSTTIHANCALQHATPR